MGKPQLSDLPDVLAAIRDITDTLASALTGKPVVNGDMAYVKDIAREAMEEMRTSMRKAAATHTGRTDDNS